MNYKLKTGDIFEIPLPSELGFSYGLFVDLKDVIMDPTYPHMLKIFDFRSEKNSQVDISLLDINELILGSVLIGGLPPTVKKGIWKQVGKKTLKINEILIPHYKDIEPSWAMKQSEIKSWFYIEEVNSQKKIKSTYDQVKHLDFFSAIGTEALQTKIAMAFLLKEGKKIEDFFALKEYFEIRIFEELVSKPLYCNLPKNLKGRALV